MKNTFKIFGGGRTALIAAAMLIGISLFASCIIDLSNSEGDKKTSITVINIPPEYNDKYAYVDLVPISLSGKVDIKAGSSTKRLSDSATWWNLMEMDGDTVTDTQASISGIFFVVLNILESGSARDGASAYYGRATKTIIKGANALEFGDFVKEELGSTYVITGNGTSFTAKKGETSVGLSGALSTVVLPAIRSDADGADVTIQFGDGDGDDDEALDIGTATASFNNTGGTWGKVTLTGKISSANADYTVYVLSSVSVDSKADIANNSEAGRALSSNSTGTVTISEGTVTTTGASVVANTSTGTLNITGGTISSEDGANGVYNSAGGTVNMSGGEITLTGGSAPYGIYNSGTGSNGGTVNITGGTITSSSSGVSNNGTGTVAISGGTITSTTSAAVSNYREGLITVSGDAVITAATTSATLGTIRLQDNQDATDARLVISGGTISNTADNANAQAILNASSGGVEISGGTITSVKGPAVANSKDGVITISGTATISSAANTGANSGTILLSGSNAATDDRLIITGETVTVENTADTADAKAIFNNSSGGVKIISSAITSAGDFAIANGASAAGKLTLGGDPSPAVTGRIRPPATGVVLIDEGADAFGPRSEQVYTLDYAAVPAVGTVAVRYGLLAPASFELQSDAYKLITQQLDLVIAAKE